MFGQRYVLPVALALLVVPHLAWSQTAAPREEFSASAVIDGQPVQFSTGNQPKRDIHAVLCCEDSFRVEGTDTIYTWRSERAAVYRGNFLGGAGFTVLMHKAVPKKQQRTPKAQLAKAWLKPAALPWAREQNERFLNDGWEIRYKDASGKLYSTAWGKQDKAARLAIATAEVKPGNAVGGFGSYEYILTLAGQGKLYDSEGKPLPFTDLRIRIGMWAESTAPRN